MTVELGVGLQRLIVALLIGLLIGLDRERASVRKAQDEFAGIRTFPLICLAGCLPMLVSPPAGLVLLAGSFLGTMSIALLSYRQEATQGRIGATTEVASVATFVLGAVAGAGGLLFAGAAGIVVAVLLVAKPPLEAFSRALEPEEVVAVLQLAVVSVIVLPILPDRGYGPWDVLNPREIWWVVVLVAGLSLVAFVAVRLLGERRGLAATGALGGLVSSTAVTVAMADRSKQEGATSAAAAAAAVLASTVMAMRVAVFAGVIHAGLLSRLVPALAAMAVVGGSSSFILARRSQGADTATRLRNPFQLRHAITFAAIYGLILLLVRVANEYLAPSAMFAVAALSAIVDVDAVTIAFAKQGPGLDAWRTAAAAVTVAAVVNTLVKLGIAAARGGEEFRRLTSRALGAMALAGAAVGLVVYF